MGIVLHEVTFDAPAPTAETIAARVGEIVGLPLVVRELASESPGKLYDLYAEIAFERYLKMPVELSAYRAGAVREHLSRTGVAAMPIADVVQGVNEAPGTQTVYVQGYVGQEPTLLLATTLALESLGGRVGEAMPEDVRCEYGRRVSAEELRRRYRKVERQQLVAVVTGVVLLPVLVPLWTVQIAWHLVKLPRWVWRVRRAVKRNRAVELGDGA